MSKEMVRQQISDRLNTLSDREIQQKSAQACKQLCELDEFKQAQVIMIYLSLPREVDTSAAILEAFETGKKALVPKVIWLERKLIPVVIETLNCEMEIGRFGLRNPVSNQTLPVSDIELVVIPGLGFDEVGNRIGRGAGFYDRFLADNQFSGLRCGLAFEDQVLNTIPVSEHDMCLDLLVTEKQIRRFNRNIGATDGKETQV